jgi:orotate phosphoribosyltransferase-like protein
MKFLDRTELFTKYQNKWVSLTDDNKVICSGSTLEEVLKKAEKKGFKNPITAKIPDLKFEFIL